MSSTNQTMTTTRERVVTLEADVIEAEKMVAEAKSEQHRLISAHNAALPEDPIAFGFPQIARAVILDRGDWTSLANMIVQGVSPGSRSPALDPRSIVELYVKGGHAALIAVISAEDAKRAELAGMCRVRNDRRDVLPRLIADETDPDKKAALESEYRALTTKTPKKN